MKRKKKKFNLLKFIVFILFLYLLYYLTTYAFNIRTKNIIILNNNFYSDETIMETAKIDDYPKFITLSKSKIKKRLLKLNAYVVK
jgi:cell division septal protein FtsQ